MDLLRDGKTGSPFEAAAAQRSGPSPQGQRGGRDRGRGGHAPMGFHRNSAGRGGGPGHAGHQGGGGGGGGFRGGRGGSGGGGRGGGFAPGRPSTTKKDTLKFDSEYDFETANEEFAGMLEKLQVGARRRANSSWADDS